MWNRPKNTKNYNSPIFSCHICKTGDGSIVNICSKFDNYIDNNNNNNININDDINDNIKDDIIKDPIKRRYSIKWFYEGYDIMKKNELEW